MWLRASSLSQAQDKETLDAEKDKASKTAQAQNDGAGTIGGVGTAGGGHEAVLSVDPNWWLIAGGAVLVLLIVTGLVIKARHNKARAEAYAAAAAVAA